MTVASFAKQSPKRSRTWRAGTLKKRGFLCSSPICPPTAVFASLNSLLRKPRNIKRNGEKLARLLKKRHNVDRVVVLIDEDPDSPGRDKLLSSIQDWVKREENTLIYVIRSELESIFLADEKAIQEILGSRRAYRLSGKTDSIRNAKERLKEVTRRHRGAKRGYRESDAERIASNVSLERAKSGNDSVKRMLAHLHECCA